ncbi:MAG TPA: DUF6518 family protein [Candidatus Dormibacteraeota bacterium]|nr:DUF6518 family protein [Candidatus Dormibacteraeota bacterium]
MQRSMTAGALTRMVAVIAGGVGVGIPTSRLQPELSAPWFSLANAASPWLTPMFFFGALWGRPGEPPWAGVTTGLLELLGYSPPRQPGAMRLITAWCCSGQLAP